MPKSPPRPALAALVLMVALSLLGAPGMFGLRRAAGATVSDHPIVQVAYRDLGSWQGQCWPWVREVVRTATGRTIGFGYREGFLHGGAAEVALAEAAPGDIIQLAQDGDDGPGADYPGLHTSIVVSVDGAGRFTVIDSNSQWDGIVRVHSYEPLASAARYPGISVHVYRFPLSGELPPIPPPPQLLPLPPGERATVSTPGDCLNLRSAARIDPSNVIRCLADGTEITLRGDTVSAGAFEWLRVATPWGEGWVASAFVQRASGTATTGGPTRPLLQFRTVAGALAADSGP